MIEVICIPLMIFFHELGHYIIAKRRGIYKGWGLIPNPHIKLVRRFPHRLDYLSGFVASSIPFPLWIFWVGLQYWTWYLLFMIASASLDFVVIFGYDLLKKDEKGRGHNAT